MSETITTFGDFGGYVLTLQRRTRKPEELYTLGNAIMAQALVLTKGASVIELATAADNPPYVAQDLAYAGKMLIAAFAAVGAQVTLGSRALPVLPVNGTAGATTSLRSAVITPGTPLPPGRAALIAPSDAGGCKVVLILADGSKIAPISVPTSDSLLLTDVGVVDIDASSTGNFKVSILY